MKTDDLITLMAEDTRWPTPLSRGLFLAGSGGAIAAAAVFFATIGVRPDFAASLQTLRFDFKFLVTLSLLVAALSLIGRLLRPGVGTGGRGYLLMIAPALLLASLIAEMIVTPASAWAGLQMGRNGLHCLTIIPALSLIVAVPLFVAMRQGAPERPGLAGAVGGLVAAGVGATLYAANCFDDSPLFVATWYPIAVILVMGAGYLAGRRWLRW